MEETSALTVTTFSQDEGTTDEVQRLRHGGQSHSEVVSLNEEAQRVAAQLTSGGVGSQGHQTSQSAKKPMLWATRRKTVRQNTGETMALPVNPIAQLHSDTFGPHSTPTFWPFLHGLRDNDIGEQRSNQSGVRDFQANPVHCH